MELTQQHKGFIVLSFNDWILKLHGKLTAGILLFLSVWLSILLHFARPIRCRNNSEHICSAQLAFEHMDEQSLHSGVRRNKTIPEPEEQFTSYEWVWLVLGCQALAFYFPYFLWHYCFRSKIKNEIASLSLKQAVKNPSWNAVKNIYKLVFCEIVCFINIIVQSAKLNTFFDEAFTSYQSDVFHFASTEIRYREDIFIRRFPRKVKCEYFMYGQSGITQSHSDICWIWINALHEKIFMIMWFWFVVLITLTVISVVCRVVYLLLLHGKVVKINSGHIPVYEAQLSTRTDYSQITD